MSFSKRFVASQVSTCEEHAFHCIVSYETAHRLLPRTNRQQWLMVQNNLSLHNGAKKTPVTTQCTITSNPSETLVVKPNILYVSVFVCMQGLQAGDEIIQFGSVSASNFVNIQSIAAIVEHSRGVRYITANTYNTIGSEVENSYYYYYYYYKR